MKKILNLKTMILGAFFLGSIISGLSSCESYLDVDEYIYDKTTLDSVFVRKEKLVEYINGAAALLPAEDQLFTNSPFPFALGSDECFASWQDSRHAAMYFLLDDITPQTSNTTFDNWPQYYRGIRKANIILQRIGECKELSDMERRDYIGRAHFLRAYFYFCLLRQYGPVPIVPDEAFAADESAENASIERSTYDECVNYICEDMKQAATFLPLTREMAFQYVPTSGAAMSVISRVRLYAASPRYNGNTRYSDWKKSTGEPMISSINDATKWGVAAAAAKRVIETGKYQLNTIERKETTLPLPANVSALSFPDGAGNIDPYLSYAGIFTGDVPAISNDELIYYYNSIKGSDSPGWIAFPYNLGGGNGMNVTQDMVDSYRMMDGRDINNSSAEYPYPAEEHMGDEIGIGYNFSGIYQVKGTMAKMYDKREARFYASIGYNNCVWPGTSYIGTLDVINYEVTYYSNGTGAPPANFQNDYNRTGYTCRKYVHQEDNMKASGSIRPKIVPVFRYAEILLNYVEAMNEMEGSYTDEVNDITVTRNVNEMKKYFNMIRFRAGLPGLTDAEVNDRTQMRELIKLERKIEFAFEGYRYHDLRRWGDAYEAYNKKIIGMNVNAKTTERSMYFTRTILDSEKITKRTFSNKMYFYPIHQTVLDKNNKLVQNPGW